MFDDFDKIMDEVFGRSKKSKKRKNSFDLDMNLFPSEEEKNNKRGYVYKDYRNKLWEKQKGKCAICKKKLDPTCYHVDHKKPVALGGKTILSNLQLLCPACHMKKTAEDRRKIAQSKKRKSCNKSKKNNDPLHEILFGSSSKKRDDPFSLL